MGRKGWARGCAVASLAGSLTAASGAESAADTNDLTTYGSGRADVIVGTNHMDFIHPGEGDDVVYGRGGTDTVYRSRGNDVIYLGPGPFHDYVVELEIEDLQESADGGRGHDRIYGGVGLDVLSGGPGDDVLYGGPGSDYLIGSSGDDRLSGGTGRARGLSGGGGDDVIRGGPQSDWARPDAGSDVVRMGGANDGVYFRNNDGTPDFIYCGPGDDTLYYEEGAQDESDVLVACEIVTVAPFPE